MGGADTFPKDMTKIIWTVLFSGLYYSSVILVICTAAAPQCGIVGGVLYCGFAVLCGLVRNDVRLKYSIGHGDLFTDLCCGLVVPMCTLTQIEYQLNNDDDGPAKKLDGQDQDPLPESCEKCI